MWIHVASTNNDPKVIAGYFVDCVKQIGGCPKILRADRGTENGSVCTAQRMFRSLVMTHLLVRSPSCMVHQQLIRE
jgi:hypothetical protein